MGITSGLWVSLFMYRDSFEPLPYFKGTIGEPQEHSRNIMGICGPWYTYDIPTIFCVFPYGPIFAP